MLPFEAVKPEVARKASLQGGAVQGRFRPQHSPHDPVTVGESPTGGRSSPERGTNTGRNVADAVSLQIRPHSRPVGGFGTQPRHQPTKPAFGLHGESAMRMDALSPASNKSVTQQRDFNLSPTRRPGPHHADADAQLNSATGERSGNSPLRSSMGKVFVNPNVKMSPSALSSYSNHNSSSTAPSSASKFAQRLPSRGLDTTSPMRQPRLASGSGELSSAAEGVNDSVIPPPALQPSAIQNEEDTSYVGSGEPSFDGPGLSVAELMAPSQIVVDLKGYDIGAELPKVRSADPLPPQFTLSTTVVSCKGAPMGTPSVPVEIPSFANYKIVSEEVGMDRALEYHVFVDVPDLFEERPAIDSSTGSLIMVPSQGVFGSTAAHVRLADNAAVTDEGGIVTSPPQSFTISITRIEGRKVAQPGIANETSPKKPNVSTTIQQPSSPPKLSSPPKSRQPGARPQRPKNVVEDKMRTLEDEDPAATAHWYCFAPAPPHGLRFDDIQRSHRTTLVAKRRATNVPDDDDPDDPHLSLKPKPLPVTNGGGEVRPSFSSILCDVERLKLVHMAQERDRLAGEPIEEAERADAEARLRERIAREEAQGGSNSIELCPLLLRLGQLMISAGAKRQGDAVEALERVVRVRMAAVNLVDYAAIRRMNEIRRKLSGDSLPGSQLGSPTGAVAAQLTTGTESAPRDYESLLQALAVLATYFKLVGRFNEALEFYDYAQNLSLGAFGVDSVHYARAVAQVAEILYYRGEYPQALRTFEQAVASAEVLFGLESSPTASLLHLQGVCMVAAGRIEAGFAAHKKALDIRNKLVGQPDDDGGAEFAVAESSVYLAVALARAGHLAEAKNYAQQASDTLRQFDTSQSPEYTLARCMILSVLSQIASAQDDVADAQKIMVECLTEIARVRGAESVEYAMLLTDLASLRIKAGNLSDAATDLHYSIDILKLSNGADHHTVARAQLLLVNATAADGLAAAQRLAEQSLATLRRTFVASHRDIGTALEVSGRVSLEERDNVAALRKLLQAYDIAKVCHATHLPDLERLLCGASTRCNLPPSEALFKELDSRVKTVKIEHGETSAYLIEPLQNMAEGHFLRGDTERAHHCLSKALRLADSSNFIFLLGHLFKPASQLSVADLNERNRISSDRLDASQAHSFAIILFSIACVFEHEGQLEDAQSTFLQALAGLEIAGLGNSLGASECLTALGRILNREGHYGDALAYFERAYNMLMEHHPTDRVFVKVSVKMIHTINATLAQNGYTLVRHTDGRHRFASYL